MSLSTRPFPRLRRAAFAALIANVGIVLTGGTVRVTESGLGCPEWPTCDGSRIVPGGAELEGWHQFVEFGNRLLTFVLLAIAIWVVLAARREASGRRDLLRLAWLQPAGVAAQAVIGGLTVLNELSPLWVAGHFLVSAGLIAAATVLHERVADRAPPDDRPLLRRLGIALVAVAASVLVLGTLVTASGPHAGDEGTYRLGLDLRTIAVAHADAVWLLVGLSIATWLVARALGSLRVAAAAGWLLAAELAQGTVGYVQYALGVPPGLVILHLLGATLVWVAAVRVLVATLPAPAPQAAAEEALIAAEVS